jgi:hypothetical protein
MTTATPVSGFHPAATQTDVYGRHPTLRGTLTLYMACMPCTA